MTFSMCISDENFQRLNTATWDCKCLQPVRSSILATDDLKSSFASKEPKKTLIKNNKYKKQWKQGECEGFSQQAKRQHRLEVGKRDFFKKKIQTKQSQGKKGSHKMRSTKSKTSCSTTEVRKRFFNRTKQNRAHIHCGWSDHNSTQGRATRK